VKFPTDSLRFRFLVSTVVWIGLGIIVGGLLVSAVFRWNVIAGYHEEMQIHMEELAVLTRIDKAGQVYLIRRMSDPRFLPKDSGFYWQINRAGYRTARSPSLGVRSLRGDIADSDQLKFKWTEGPTGKTLEYGRQRGAGDGGAPLQLMMASDKALVDVTMAEFNRSLAISLGLFAVLMLAGGVLQFTYGLRPLRRLGDAIAAIRTGQADRMKGGFPAEIRPLVNDLNALLDANSQTIARSRILAGNLAHGLRTPLSILIDEAETLSESGNDDAARTILHEAQRMKKQIDFHLARARSATAQPRPGQVTQLRATVRPLVQALERLHRQRNVAFEVLANEEVLVACDAVDLAEIISNLLDNAGKWAKNRCWIDWHKRDSDVEITIDDDGPGLAPALRESAFAAGQRLDDLTPGSGLGLAISRDLARLYGGDVMLSGAQDGGLRATIVMPMTGRE
jgi:signal transduction histidine kinase